MMKIIAILLQQIIQKFFEEGQRKRVVRFRPVIVRSSCRT
jgi:hypothetical protein